MLISLIVTNGENFKEIEEPSLTALGDLEWNDPVVHYIFRRWINLIYVKSKFHIKWPVHDVSMETPIIVFRQYFPKLTATIDCTEIFIDHPKTYKTTAQVYFNCKKYATIKFLIACTLLDSISFISKAWGGCVSNIGIVKDFGLFTVCVILVNLGEGIVYNEKVNNQD